MIHQLKKFDMKFNLILTYLLFTFLLASCQNKKNDKNDIMEEYEGELRYTRINGLYGFENEEGKLMIEAKYTGVGNFFENRASVSINDKWGFIDTHGKIIVPLIYDYVDKFSFGMAYVKLNGKKGFVNKDGKLVIPIKYDHTSEFNEFGLSNVGTIIATKGNLNINKYGLINKDGKEILPIAYDGIDIFVEAKPSEVAVITNNGMAGIVNKQGQIIIPIKYDADMIIYETPCLLLKGIIRVKMANKYALFNMANEKITLFTYDYIYDCDEDNKIPVTLNKKESFINVNGEKLK